MSKYTAHINITDKDYMTYAGSESINVGSWEEAQSYCKSSSWTGEYYTIDYLVNNKTGKSYKYQLEVEEDE